MCALRLSVCRSFVPVSVVYTDRFLDAEVECSLRLSLILDLRIEWTRLDFAGWDHLQTISRCTL